MTASRWISTARAVNAWVILTGVLLLIFIGVRYFLGSQLRADFARLHLSGVPGTAKIVGKSEDDSRGWFRHHYFVIYEYRIDRSDYHKVDFVTEKAYQELQSGQQVDTMYLPEDPKVCRLDIENTSDTSSWILLALSLLLIAGGVTFHRIKKDQTPRRS